MRSDRWGRSGGGPEEAKIEENERKGAKSRSFGGCFSEFVLMVKELLVLERFSAPTRVARVGFVMVMMSRGQGSPCIEGSREVVRLCRADRVGG